MSLDIVKHVALGMVGTAYRWGGDDPMAGWDCSGYVQELLAMVGMDPPGDQTAQSLFNHFERNGTYNRYGLGALAFYGQSSTQITHVAFCIDTHLMVEAGGGGSRTLTQDDAIKQNAYVRVRPIKARKDLVAVIKPDYRTIGML